MSENIKPESDSVSAKYNPAYKGAFNQTTQRTFGDEIGQDELDAQREKYNQVLRDAQRKVHGDDGILGDAGI